MNPISGHDHFVRFVEQNKATAKITLNRFRERLGGEDIHAALNFEEADGVIVASAELALIHYLEAALANDGSIAAMAQDLQGQLNGLTRNVANSRSTSVCANAVRDARIQALSKFLEMAIACATYKPK